MCDPATLALIATGLSTGTAIYQGEQQKDWNEYQANQAAADANADQKAAMVQAEKIRRLGKKQAAEAAASIAASGAKIGEGTALRIEKEIIGNAEEDALMTVFGGNDAANRGYAEASALRMKGRQAQQAGYLEAGGSVLGGAYDYSKWKKQK